MTDKLVVALVGNPNCGKTTLFNAITGERAHVGNYPGVTVKQRVGILRHAEVRVEIVDLPGTYSLTPYSTEERITRDFILDERPDVVIDVIDASNPERHLYLAVQLLEIGVPLVLALNKSDVAEHLGIRVNAEQLGAQLRVPAMPIVATDGIGVEALLEQAVAVGRGTREWQPLEVPYEDDVSEHVELLTELILESHFLADRFPARWLSIKCIENDDQVVGWMKQDGEAGRSILSQSAAAAGAMRERHRQEPIQLLANGRFGFIEELCRYTVVRPGAAGPTISDRLDRVTTHKLLGPLAMLGVLYGVYWFVFAGAESELLAWAGIPGSMIGWVEGLFLQLGGLAAATLPAGLLQSLVVDGIVGGVGGVLSFVPLIFLMFLAISILEESGYMARLAFMLDRVMGAFGLHGSSVVALILSGGIAGGCAVPGIMATRTVRDRRERFATILICGLMNCGAKLPVYALLIAAFFASYRPVVMLGLTVTSWSVALAAALVLRRTLLKGPKDPFMLELPPYRLPRPGAVLSQAAGRCWLYMRKAGTVILAISIVLWALMTFPRVPEARLAGLSPGEAAAEALAYSAAGRLGRGLQTLMEPIGSDWRTNIALVGGFAAKEVIISTLGTAYSLGEVDPEESAPLAAGLAESSAWSPLKACALMVFIMFYAPCVATVAVMIQEMKSWRWGLFGVAYPTVLAWMLAFVVYQGGRLLGLG